MGGWWRRQVCGLRRRNRSWLGRGWGRGWGRGCRGIDKCHKAVCGPDFSAAAVGHPNS